MRVKYLLRAKQSMRCFATRSRDIALKRHLNVGYLLSSNVCFPANSRAVQASFFLTLAFLTIPPFWRHAGVGATDLA
jgi:hypothetical protein